MDRKLELECLFITEETAISSAKFMGKGDEISVDKAAIYEMKRGFSSLGWNVIDEEEDLVYNTYERVIHPDFDIVSIPLEGPSICAKGGSNALSIITISEKGSIQKVPDIYMEKIAVGPKLKGIIDINLSPSQNLKAIANALEVKIKNLTVVILDRPRHRDLIKEIINIGAKIKLIGDGDVSAGISTAKKEAGVDILMGIGGAREGIVTASALKCMGGDMQGRLIIRNSEDIEAARKFGINDFNKIFKLDELVKGDAIFIATGVTDGDFLKGVRFFRNGVHTYSVVMTSKNIRYINSIHYFNS